jgi:hypothetical protein
LALAEKHPVIELERSCQQAIQYGAWRLRDLREWLDRSTPPQLTFLEKHPLIRDLESYGQIVPRWPCASTFASNTENQNQPKETLNEPKQP